MARKKKRKSRKSSSSSKGITYDSKETRTVFGLVSTLVTLTFFISVFVDTDGQNFFTELNRTFGATTFFVGLFFLNLSLYLFDFKFPTCNLVSITAQIVLLILVPAFLASGYETEFASEQAAEMAEAGGRFGHFLAYEVFADRLSFAQFTQLILGLAIAIALPIALSVSVATIVERAKIVLEYLFKAIKSIFTGSEKVVETVKEMDLPEKASRFSDFQRKLDAQKAAVKDDDDSKDDVKKETKALSAVKKQNIGVNVKEGEMDEEKGLSSMEQLKYPDWQLPPTTLLNPYRKSTAKDSDKERNIKIIEQTLGSFNIDAEVVDAFIGPSVIQYALDLPLGVKVAKVANLAENLALALGVASNAVRIESIPGSTYLGIEVPRANRDMVKIREIMESDNFAEDGKYLPIPIGKGIDGNPIVDNIQKMPHLLIAGATGSGKSVLTNSFIVSLLMNKTPDELRLLLVDPKQVELMDYNGIPHLLTPVITDMDKVVNALKWAVGEMERRYTTMAGEKVRNIESYNDKLGFAAMPYIVIVIDEMADMMMTTGKVEAESAIVRLTQKARAVGIHLILATQRPSVNVITGLIKANVPTRIGMSVTSGTDSRVILDEIGAETLMGNGDLLYRPAGVKSLRLQSPYVSPEEINRVVNFIKSQVPEVEYITSILETVSDSESGGELGDISGDDLFEQALRTVVSYQKGSSSFLQRKLNIGFNRAARMLEELEEAGVVGPARGSKPREVLITDADAFLAQVKA